MVDTEAAKAYGLIFDRTEPGPYFYAAWIYPGVYDNGDRLLKVGFSSNPLRRQVGLFRRGDYETICVRDRGREREAWALGSLQRVCGNPVMGREVFRVPADLVNGLWRMILKMDVWMYGARVPCLLLPGEEGPRGRIVENVEVGEECFCG